MKFIVNVEEKDPRKYGPWSQQRFNALISFIEPKLNTTIVLSKIALTILACCIKVDRENNLLTLNDIEYKYVVNPDEDDNVLIEYEDNAGFIRTIQFETTVINFD